MATEGYDLVLTVADGVSVSMVGKYGSGVVEYERGELKAKKVATNNWAMENGEEIFFPSDGVKTEACDLTVSLCYAGKYGTWQGVRDKLVAYLKTSVFTLEDAYSNKKYKGSYFSSLSDEDVFSDPSAGDVVTYKLKFRVTEA